MKSKTVCLFIRLYWTLHKATKPLPSRSFNAKAIRETLKYSVIIFAIRGVWSSSLSSGLGLTRCGCKTLLCQCLSVWLRASPWRSPLIKDLGWEIKTASTRAPQSLKKYLISVEWKKEMELKTVGKGRRCLRNRKNRKTYLEHKDA